MMMIQLISSIGTVAYIGIFPQVMDRSVTDAYLDQARSWIFRELFSIIEEGGIFIFAFSRNDPVSIVDKALVPFFFLFDDVDFL